MCESNFSGKRLGLFRPLLRWPKFQTVASEASTQIGVICRALDGRSIDRGLRDEISDPLAIRR